MKSNHCVIRKAAFDDIYAVLNLYDEVNDEYEITEGFKPPGWKKGVYPTINTLQGVIEKNSLYIVSCDYGIVGACIINHEQHPAYAQLPWTVEAAPEEVLVIHDLVTSPKHRRKGIGRQLMDFIIDYGHMSKAKTIRLDTHHANIPARNLYEGRGFSEIIVWTGIISGMQQTFSVFEYIL